MKGGLLNPPNLEAGGTLGEVRYFNEGGVIEPPERMANGTKWPRR